MTSSFFSNEAFAPDKRGILTRMFKERMYGWDDVQTIRTSFYLRNIKAKSNILSYDVRYYIAQKQKNGQFVLTQHDETPRYIVALPTEDDRWGLMSGGKSKDSEVGTFSEDNLMTAMAELANTEAAASETNSVIPYAPTTLNHPMITALHHTIAHSLYIFKSSPYENMSAENMSDRMEAMALKFSPIRFSL